MDSTLGSEAHAAGSIPGSAGALGFDKDLTIFFVGSVMEEDCDGLCWKYIIEEEGIKPDFVISTEPTNLGVYRGHRGMDGRPCRHFWAPMLDARWTAVVRAA